MAKADHQTIKPSLMASINNNNKSKNKQREMVNMKKFSSGCGTKRASQDSSVSVKRLKMETKDLKENSSVWPKKSMSSTGIVVSVSDGRKQRRLALAEAVFKGSNKLNDLTSYVVSDPISVSEKDYGVVADVPVTLSPAKAFRIETLKRRFADTISRAEQKMAECERRTESLMIIKLQQKVAKLEEVIVTKKRESTARMALTETEKKKDEKIAQDNNENMKELIDKRRDRIRRGHETRTEQREKARIAIVEMEKNTDKITQNIDSMRELEKLCGCVDYSTKILLGIPFKTLLDLRLKPDDAFEDQEEEE